MRGELRGREGEVKNNTKGKERGESKRGGGRGEEEEEGRRRKAGWISRVRDERTGEGLDKGQEGRKDKRKKK